MSHKHGEPHKKRQGPGQDAIKRAGDEAKAKPELAAERTLKHEPIGTGRIFIELEEEPGKAMEDSRKYSGLALEIVKALEKEGIDKLEEKRFMMHALALMKRRFQIIYGDPEFGLLSKSLETSKWDCDNSSFLMFDVARELGIKMNVVVVQEHVFVRTENFFFQTTTGSIRSISEMKDRFPRIYLDTSDPEKIQAVSYNNKGVMQAEKGDFEKAVSSFTTAIVIAPNYATAYINLGVAHHSLGRYELASVDYEKAFEIDPGSCSLYLNRGNNRLKQGDRNGAIDDFSKAVEFKPRKPTLAMIYRSRGNAYFEKGDYAMAMADYNRAIRANPKDDLAHKNLGLAHVKTGTYWKAIECFKNAIAINPDQDTYYSLGLVYSRADDYDNAIKSYEQALGLGPRKPEILYAMGGVHMKKAEYAKAIENFKEATELGLRNEIIFSHLVTCHYEIGDLEEALRNSEEIVNINPQNEEALENIALLCRELGRIEKAEDAEGRLQAIREKGT